MGDLFDHLIDGLWLAVTSAFPIVAMALVCGLAASFALSVFAVADEGAIRLARMLAAFVGALWIAPSAVDPLLEYASASFHSAAASAHAGATLSVPPLSAAGQDLDSDLVAQPQSASNDATPGPSNETPSSSRTAPTP